MKPATEIYADAVASVGLRPQEIFFVDDLEANVEGARQAGFDAVHYTSAAELDKALRKRGVRINY